jgi:hypothetical protein
MPLGTIITTTTSIPMQGVMVILGVFSHTVVTVCFLPLIVHTDRLVASVQRMMEQTRYSSDKVETLVYLLVDAEATR